MEDGILSLTGRVISGRRLGRSIGFPTANLEIGAGCRVATGVWAATAQVGQKAWPAVVNIGYSPTVVENGALRAEAHLIGFSGDLYGSTLTLRLVKRLRGERRFSSMEALREQISKDCGEALRAVGDLPTGQEN